MDSKNLSREKALARLRRLAVLLDSSIPIPGTKIKIGLDPLLGLIPGIGDASALILSASIVLYAAQINVSTLTLVKMLANLAVDTLIGTIPLLGDLFDFGWKANLKNMTLLESATISTSNRPAWQRTLIAVAVLVGLLVLGCVATVLSLVWLFHYFL